MKRQVIKIDEEKCNGCGICANACHEGAIDIVDGKAKLVRENFCDGFGDCLPSCPVGAITFETREAPEYDEAAVKAAQEEKKKESVKMQAKTFEEQQKKLQEFAHQGHRGGCPGAAARAIKRESSSSAEYVQTTPIQSELINWPVQIKLAPITAPYFDGAKLLIAADCTAYAYASFHKDFIKGRVALIGCPKLDDIDYSEKLCEIIKNNDIKEVTIVRMEVPCCGGLQRAAENALRGSGKFIPWQVRTVTIDGNLI